MGRYPRTVAEFAAHQRFVVVKCRPCQRTRLVPPDVLEAAFGPDLDLYSGVSALEAELRCDMCGEKHRVIEFCDATQREFGVPLSDEEARNDELERRALWAPRDRGKMGRRTG